MFTRMLFLSVAALALFAGAMPARADGEEKAAASAAPKLSKSDEDFLASMSDADFPGSNDAGVGAGGLTGAEFDFASDSSTTSSGTGGTKYVYHGYSDMMLRRVIKDDRVDDGYVQGLLRQRGPQ
ncbi:MAG: hypothetical protein KGQ41_05135 [Alphaproteobacteria bacterium]|nr:hypothetical protein [Alphaproteobacteria bacterium]